MEDYAYVEYIINRWHQATGAHRDNIRALFIQASIEIEESPLIVARVASHLFPLVEENYKQIAQEKEINASG